MVKNLPANAGDKGSVLGLGRFPGGGNGNPPLAFLLGKKKSHRQKSLAGYSLWGHKEPYMTEWLSRSTKAEKHFFFWLYHAAFGILVLPLGIKSRPFSSENIRVLTNGLPGNSLDFALKLSNVCFYNDNFCVKSHTLIHAHIHIHKAKKGGGELVNFVHLRLCRQLNLTPQGITLNLYSL